MCYFSQWQNPFSEGFMKLQCSYLKKYPFSLYCTKGNNFLCNRPLSLAKWYRLGFIPVPHLTGKTLKCFKRIWSWAQNKHQRNEVGCVSISEARSYITYQYRLFKTETTSQYLKGSITGHYYILKYFCLLYSLSVTEQENKLQLFSAYHVLPFLQLTWMFIWRKNLTEASWNL